MSRRFGAFGLLCVMSGLVAACQAQAPAHQPAPASSEQYRACAQDSDCAITSNSCCNACEPVSANQLLAVSKQSQAAELAARCPVIPPCVPCPPSAEADATSQFFAPACEAGRCEVRDQRAALTPPDRAAASL